MDVFCAEPGRSRPWAREGRPQKKAFAMTLWDNGIDSIEWMGLLLELEALGGLALHNSELAQLGSVSDLLALIARKLAP